MRAFLILSCLCCGIACSQPNPCRTQTDINAPGLVPAPENQMSAIFLNPASKDAELRDHAWNLLSWVTAPVVKDCPEARFETWMDRDTVFCDNLKPPGT